MHRFNFYFFTLLLIFVFTGTANAQFGLAFKYVSGFEDIPSNVPNRTNDRLQQNGASLALDYRIKMVNYGLLFGPEVALKYLSTNGIDVYDVSNLEVGKVSSIKSFGVNLPVTIYPFHFNQCDECPTFKKANFFKNNFFVQPVIGYELRNWTTDPSGIVDDIKEQFVVAGIGIGADIHFGKIIRLSPIVQYKQNFPITDNVLYHQKLKPASLEVGVRLGWGR